MLEAKDDYFIFRNFWWQLFDITLAIIELITISCLKARVSARRRNNEASGWSLICDKTETGRNDDGLRLSHSVVAATIT